MPTLGEFVDHAKQYGFTRRLVTFESSQLGRVTMIYLWRDADHFADATLQCFFELPRLVDAGERKLREISFDTFAIVGHQRV